MGYEQKMLSICRLYTDFQGDTVGRGEFIYMRVKADDFLAQYHASSSNLDFMKTCLRDLQTNSSKLASLCEKVAYAVLSS